MPRWSLVCVASSVLMTMGAAPGGAEPPREWWVGAVETSGPTGVTRLPIAVTLASDASGAWFASLDVAPSPFGGGGLLAGECTDVTYTPARIAFTLPGTPASFFALDRAAAGAPEAVGELRTEGTPPLTVRLRAAPESEVALTVPARPQTPRPPFLYQRQDAALISPADGVTLAGTLTVPAPPPGADAAPRPAILLLTAGGQQDRDNQIGFHRPLLIVADRLTRAGVVTLRFDDRGTGGSSGVHLDATPEMLAADARAAVALLRAQPGVDPKNIGVLGIGESSVVAAMAAAEDPSIAWLILLSPQGLPGADIVALREQRRMEAEGEDPGFVAAQTESTRALVSLIAAGADHETIRGAIRTAMLTGVKALRGDGLEPEQWQLDDTVAQQLQNYTSPAIRAWIAADPRETYRRVRVPVLALAGDRDLTVPTADNLPEVEAALRAPRDGGGIDATVRRFPAANHLLQPSVTGFSDEIATIRTTMMPEVLDVIGAWIAQRTSGGK